MSRQSQRAANWKRTTFLLLGSVLLVAYVVFPFYWVLTVSVTPEQKVFARGIELFPSSVTLDNYFNLFQVLPFAKYFRNSVIIATSTMLLSLTLATPAAYAFARFAFRGRKPLVSGILMLYMIPPVVLLVPLLVIFRNLHFTNTYQGVILAEATGTLPFAVWLLIGYFAALPRELEEAAAVDGCSPIGALLRITLPLAIPGLVAAALFVFIVAWNNFLYAFLLAPGEDVKTLPVVMRSFVRGESGVFWGTVMASATLTSAPVIAIFLFFQRYLIGGLSAGAVKG